MQHFNTDLLKAEWTESAVRLWAEIIQQCWVQKMDHRIFPYDLTMVGPKHQLTKFGKRWTAEIKALDWEQKGYTDAVLEIWKDDHKSKRPDWFQFNDEIDLIGFVNMKTYMCHWYSAKQLKVMFERMESQGWQPGAAHYSMSNRTDCPGFIYKVPYTDESYGWKLQTNLSDMLFYAGHIVTPQVKEQPSLKKIWDKLNKAHWAKLKRNHPENFEDIHTDMKTKVLSLVS